MLAAATDRQKTRTRISFTYKTFKGEVVRDDAGEYLLIPTITFDFAGEPDVGALTELHKRAFDEASKCSDSETGTHSANQAPVDTDGVTRRLAESIHVHRDQMYEDMEEGFERRLNERLKAMGMTVPTSAVGHPRSTDDNDDDYMYAAWAALYIVSDSNPGNSGNPGNPGNPDVDRGT